MKKYKVYDKGTEIYNQKIRDYVEKFKRAFPNYHGNLEIEKELRKNLNKFIEHTEEYSIRQFPFGFCKGVYNRLTRSIKYASKTTPYEEKHTIRHEMTHALTRKITNKRVTMRNVLLSEIFGRLEIGNRSLEEGMTEYVTCVIDGDGLEKYFNSSPGVDTQLTIVNKLAKIYGQELVLDYYLGENKNLITAINKTGKNNFKKVRYLSNQLEREGTALEAFKPIRCEEGKKKKYMEEDLLFRLFKENKMVPTRTIDDFKYNLKQLFDFYESDLYTLVDEIGYYEQTPPSEDKKSLYEYNLQMSIKKFKIFDNILKEEWKKLNRNDENQYKMLVSEEINKQDEEIKEVIQKYTNYEEEDVLPKKGIGEEQRRERSYSTGKSQLHQPRQTSHRLQTNSQELQSMLNELNQSTEPITNQRK